jgi:hypothetical protein
VEDEEEEGEERDTPEDGETEEDLRKIRDEAKARTRETYVPKIEQELARMNAEYALQQLPPRTTNRTISRYKAIMTIETREAEERYSLGKTRFDKKMEEKRERRRLERE